MVALNFNARQVDPFAALEPLPSDTYTVQISNTSEQITSTNNGKMLVIEYTVKEGQFNGRKLVDRLNIVNPNEKTVEIAFRQLAAICYATGRLDIQDSAQLHGAALKILVSKDMYTDKKDGKDKYSNSVKSYMDLNGNEADKIKKNLGHSSPQGGNNSQMSGQGQGNSNGAQDGNQGNWQGNGQGQSGQGSNNGGGNWQGNQQQQPQNNGNGQGGGMPSWANGG